MIHKCLPCRGRANSGRLPKDRLWEWMAVTVNREAAYHLVWLRSESRVVSGGGTVWNGVTACRMEVSEELDGK